MYEDFRRRLIAKVPRGMKLCPTCGEYIGKKETHETIERVVKKNCLFDGKRAGEIVKIEPRHLKGPALEVTVSLEEQEKIEETRKKPREQKQGLLGEMVMNNQEAFIAQTKAMTNRGKDQYVRAQERMIERALDAKYEAIDQEPRPRSRKAVEE